MFALESEFIAWVYGCLTHSYEFIKREKAKTQKEIGKRACVCVCVRFLVYQLMEASGAPSLTFWEYLKTWELALEKDGCIQDQEVPGFDVRVEILIH